MYESEFKNGEKIVKMKPSKYLAVSLIKKEGIALDNDERCRPIPTSAKL